MSERKVLNKYFPPDYDPSKIPRMPGMKKDKNKQFTIRVMIPANVRCNTCGEYIYKGKKFNSRCEQAEGERYLGIRTMRFYIRCPKCISEITFKTDLANNDYEIEHGATRNFEAQRTAVRLENEEQKRIEEEEANNPMKMLEKRTAQSQRDIEELETLEMLRDRNAIKANVDSALEKQRKELLLLQQELHRAEVEEDEAFIAAIFAPKKLESDTDSSDSDGVPAKFARVDKVLPNSSHQVHAKCGTKNLQSIGKNVSDSKTLLISSKPSLTLKKDSLGSTPLRKDNVQQFIKRPESNGSSKTKNGTVKENVSVISCNNDTSMNEAKKSSVSETCVSNALSLLGAYSDSD